MFEPWDQAFFDASQFGIKDTDLNAFINSEVW